MQRRAKTAIGAAIAAAVAVALPIALPLTDASEGLRLKAYQDPARIWTICNGRTTDVKPGDTATREQCRVWLHSELAEHMTAAAEATPRLVENPQALAAAGDFHYNAGPGWWGKSPMAADFAAGRWAEGCKAFIGYIVMAQVPKPIAGARCTRNAKGKLYCELPGLVTRRQREARMCQTGRWQ